MSLLDDERRKASVVHVAPTLRAGGHGTGPSPRGLTANLLFSSLNETERSYLRLVYEGLTSMQIAAQRNVSAAAVDRILRTARAKLGDLPRREAARRFVEYELVQHLPSADGLSVAGAPECSNQSWGAQRLALVGAPSIPSPAEAERPNDSRQTSSAHQRAIPLSGARYVGFRSWLFGSDRSLRNDLDTWTRVAVICVIAAGAACMIGAALSLLIVLGRILASL